MIGWNKSMPSPHLTSPRWTELQSTVKAITRPTFSWTLLNVDQQSLSQPELRKYFSLKMLVFQPGSWLVSVLTIEVISWHFLCNNPSQLLTKPISGRNIKCWLSTGRHCSTSTIEEGREGEERSLSSCQLPSPRQLRQTIFRGEGSSSWLPNSPCF